MSIHKKKGFWYAAVYQGTRNNKQGYEWSEGFVNKADAQYKELEMKKSVLELNHKVYDKESFVFIAEKWLKSREKILAPSTYRNNKWYYSSYIMPYFEDKLIGKIDTMDILDFMLSLNKSPATINKAMNILKQIFDFSVTMKQRRDNPCVGIKKPEIKRTKKETWNEKEINKFLNLRCVKQETGYTAFLILFSTGMRPGEVCGLRWCDLKEDHVIPTVGIDKARKYTDLKNSKAHENVYLDIRVLTQLKKHRIAQESIYLSKGIEFNPKGFINCLSPDFRPMTPDYLTKRFNKLVVNNNLRKIRLYDARHSLGTNMMRNGVNPKEVSEVLRHTSVKTTLDNYSHVDKEMYKNTISMYNNQIFKRSKQSH